MSSTDGLHPIRNVTLRFREVRVPVSIATAAKREDQSFRFLHRECGSPVTLKQWCPLHDRELAPEEVVRGFEFSRGQYVPLEDDELEKTRSSDAIELDRFVPLDDVPELLLDCTYYLVPPADRTSRHVYAFVLEIFRRRQVAGLARFALRNREYPSLVRVLDGALCLTTLFQAEDVRSAAPIRKALAGAEPTKAELELGDVWISQGLRGFPRWKALQRDKLAALIARKKDAGEIIESPNGATVDLEHALRGSVSRGKKVEAKAG